MIKMYAIFARETLVQMKYEGKLAAQAGHCFLHAWWDAEARAIPSVGYTERVLPMDYMQTILLPYKRSNDARKIVLVVDTVEQLKALYDKYSPYMGATLVEDCGYTVFTEPTITGVGLGPIDDEWLKGSELKALETLKNEVLKNNS